MPNRWLVLVAAVIANASTAQSLEERVGRLEKTLDPARIRQLQGVPDGVAPGDALLYTTNVCGRIRPTKYTLDPMAPNAAFPFYLVRELICPEGTFLTVNILTQQGVSHSFKTFSKKDVILNQDLDGKNPVDGIQR